MATMEDQIVSAVEIAYDPHHASYLDALRYVEHVREDPSSWRPCLTIFLQVPRRSDGLRLFCLGVVTTAIEKERLDQETLKIVIQQIMPHVKEHYATSSDEGTTGLSGAIENKLAQSLTAALAASESGTGWPSCFGDMMSLASGVQGPWSNVRGVLFYLRFLNAVHDEIGDQLRARTRAEQERVNAVKDHIRANDMQKIALSWKEILEHFHLNEELVSQLCLKAIGKWVSWIDISLVVNQQSLPLLFQQLERAQDTDLSATGENARDAAVSVFTEIVAKKMALADKVEVISFLNIENVVSKLSSCPPLVDPQKSYYNVDLAETVAKLVNITVIELVRVLEAEVGNEGTWRKAENTMRAMLPHLLRYFSDEYDEVCSTVIPAMNDLLAFLQHSMKGQDAATQRAVMLLPILKAIFAKMRYDETTEWLEDDDDTDEAEFQDLRRRLATLQQSVASADEQLYTNALLSMVNNTFDKLRLQPSSVNWRDLDLALCEMFLFGDLATKGGGLFRKNKPNSPAADKLVEMIMLMLDSGITAFDHPAIHQQVMEVCVRYTSFFEKHRQYIHPMLESFLRFAHSANVKVRLRAWYLISRFVRQLRLHLGAAASSVINSMQDLLTVKAEPSNTNHDDDMSSDDASHSDSIFDSQLYLFEAIGCICGVPAIPVNEQAELLHAVTQPRLDEVQTLLDSKITLSPLNILQVHHELVALGTIARGYAEWIPANSQSEAQVHPLVKDEFLRIAATTLLVLQNMRASREIREAATHNFSRLIGIVGESMLARLPQWIDAMLGPSSINAEIAEVLRILSQVIFSFKKAAAENIDALYILLLQKVFSGLSVSPSGTDESIALSDLKRDYLGFLTAMMGNEIGEIIVSSKNQPIFDTVVRTMEHFCKDTRDLSTAKTAFQILIRMSLAWGGPDAVSTPGQVNGSAHAQAAIPGFDQFMMTRFSPITWSMLTEQTFNPRDAQARSVLNEAASLQKTIYAKTGQSYTSWLKEKELKDMGMTDAMIATYLEKLTRLDLKEFRAYFAQLISQTKSG